VPLELTPYALAAVLRVPRTRVERLVREETGITPDTALRLAEAGLRPTSSSNDFSSPPASPTL
jgi:addiction module HigA family antidote